MRKFKRIGILGGTFNPIHLGHLILADQARHLLHLERIIFIPTNLPPHKSSKVLALAQERYHMIALATKSNPSFKVSALEIKRGGISYSMETVKKLKSFFPQAKFYFIVGSDFLKEFSAWKDINKLRKICKFVVAQRPGYLIKRLPGNTRMIKITALNISSTDIRKRIRAKQTIRYLVPEKVRKYILKKRLY